MDTAELQAQLDEAWEHLEEERIKAADLSSALVATELQVTALERRLRDAVAAAEASELREQLAKQTEAAEEYRIEAADMRSMFDAMQHRIDILSAKAAQSTAAPQAEQDATEAESALIAARQRIAELESAAGSSEQDDELRRELSNARQHIEVLDAEVEGLIAQIAKHDAGASQIAATVGQVERLTEENGQLAAQLAEFSAAAAAALGGPASPEDVRALGPLLHHAAELEARSARAGDTEAELRRALQESEASLHATRTARDQWLQRLEDSGRDKAELERRLRDYEKQSSAAGASESELGELRAQLEQRTAELESLRDEIRLAHEARESLDVEIAGARGEIDETESRARQLETVLAAESEKATRLQSRIAELEAEASRASEALAGTLASVDDGASQLEEARSALRAEREKASELEALLSEVDGELVALKDALAERSEESEAAGRRIAELEASRSETAAEGEQERSRSEQLGAELEQLRARLVEVEGEKGAGAEHAAELEALLAAADGELAESKEALAARSEESEAAGRRIAELEASRSETAAEGEQERSRAGQLEAELEQLRARLGEVEAEAGTRAGHLEERARAAENERDEVTARLGEQEAQLATLVERWNLAETQSEDLAGSQNDIGAQVASLVEEIEATLALSEDLRIGVGADRELLSSLESRLGDSSGLGQELQAARSRAEELEAEVGRLAARVTDAEASGAIDGELREQLAELEAQRSALAEEVENERSLRTQSERLVEELRQSSEHAQGDDTQGRIESLQAAFDAAVAKHAEEALALREELELHKSLAHDREQELGRLSEECSILQQSVEDAIGELEGVRADQVSLAEQLREIDEPEEAGDSAGVGHDSSLNGGTYELSLVADETEDESAASVAADEDIAEALAEIAGADASNGVRELLVVNFDGDPTFQSAVETAVASTKNARFHSSQDGETPAGIDVRLAINLVSENFDPELMKDCSRWGLDEPEALTYCGKNGRGVFFRKVMFFPPPCDFEECAARLLAGTDSLQRLLAVGEDVDFMSGLRESLGKMRTSTAIAFDGRQAVDLIPMVKPQLVLVDLNLPRGDGLRVASQVAANPDLRHVKIAMFWSRHVDPQVFRQQAIYAMRDFHMDPEQLTRSIARSLSEEPGSDAAAPAFRRGGRGAPGQAASNQPGH